MKYRQRIHTNILVLIAFTALTVLSFGFRPENGTLALVTKIVQEVMKKSASNEWSKATSGDMLIVGDQVRTGKQSLAVIKFMDRSIVRVREQSELTISASSQTGGMVKIIQLSKGSFGFDVKKQQNDRFRLTSPTSVASIRGTRGKLSGGSGNDTLVVTEGLVNLKNNVSTRDIDVPAGFIGFSNQDGSISSRKATEQELADANNAALGGSSNELNLELRNSKGDKKELKIRYKQ
ncbi:MAG: FecR domain-containing protein [Ignavibacteria bacterium]|nr:FecR domain-containing protein [Ignavibacteria bacterium]